MTPQSDFFAPVLDGGDRQTPPTEPRSFDDVTNWSVSLLFHLDDLAAAPVEEERRLRMLRALTGQSPMLTVRHDSIALTISAVGTRDQAVSRAVESAWTCLDAGDVTAVRLIGVNLISNERVDASVEDGLPLIYDRETDQAVEHEQVLSEIRGLSDPRSLISSQHSTITDDDRAEAARRGDSIAPTPAPQIAISYFSGVREKPWVQSTGLDANRHPGFVHDLGQYLAASHSLHLGRGREQLRIAQTVLDLLQAHFLVGEWIVNQKAAAEVLGVSKQRAHQLLRGDGAPQPVAHLDGNPIWMRCQIERFAEDRK